MNIRAKRYLLFGSGGQLGTVLAPLLAARGEVTTAGRREVDLADPAAVQSLIRRVKPDVLVNAAGYTRVDQAESDRRAVEVVNAYAPGVMAEEARRLRALLVHYSTDYVFDGQSTVPYTEGDTPNPVNHYGYTKWLGERNVAEHAGRYLIPRLAWMYGPEGRNFFRTVLRLAETQDELRIVSDQIGTPTPVQYVANETMRMLDLAERDDLGGMFHLTAAGEASWYTFASFVMKLAAKNGLPSRPVVPIPSSAYPTPARRPAYSVLDCTLAAETFGVRQIDWREGVYETMLAYLRAHRAAQRPALAGS